MPVKRKALFAVPGTAKYIYIHIVRKCILSIEKMQPPWYNH